MTSTMFWIAATIAGAGFFIHVVLGGIKYVRPMFQSDMAESAKWLTFISWHTSSIVLASQALGFAYLALYPAHTSLAIFLIAVCLTGVLLFIVTGAFRYSGAFSLPGIYIFAATALFGIWGVVASI